MNKKKKWSLLLVVAILMAGCTYYETAPGVYATTPASKFDRSYAAAIGALASAEGTLAGVLGRLMAVVEAYPDLKADATMRELSDASSGELVRTPTGPMP